MVINETAARVMGMDDPVGKWVTWDSVRYSIIGVIQDFHFLPVTEEISPLFLFDAPQNSSTLFVKVNGNNTDQTVEYMQDIWEKTNPGFLFEYRFLDAAYDELYSAEDRLGKIFQYFSILTILISCLGLFGLAAFLAEQRTKEIGIRKILGAGISQIIATLAGSFLKWVVLANIIALATVSFQTLRAAARNPVNAIKYE